MTAPLGDIKPEKFLQAYWQKKPCLIRGAIPGFELPLDANDLAGLACEEMAEARLVTGCAEAADWQLTHGPFDEQDFASLPAENWTLLVQDVEKHYAPLQELMRLFSFIPGWRLDDLMISYAVTGGSVGPHTDQYDVFLLQAEGRRRWQIAQTFDPALLDNCPLNVLQSFTAEQEWVLEPGDMLYLPPNVAHHGVALDAGMTWSIGSRAPSGADLLQGLGEWLAFAEDEGGRYTDPDLQPALRAGEIDQSALQALKQFMHDRINDNRGIDQFLAGFLSRFRQANEPVPPPQSVTPEQLQKEGENSLKLMRNPWARLTWIEHDNDALLFASGQPFACSIQLAELLCGFEPPMINTRELDGQSLATLAKLVNNGHFILT